MTNLFINFFINCDAPRPWGIYLQDSASPQMEALIELHDNIMFYLVIILFGVAWILVSIIRNYANHKSPISNKYLNHGTVIELIWIITPALVLVLIAFPSFKLLYSMDEVTDPSLTVFVEGHQWYWSYQYPDFLNDDDEELEFNSYLVPESEHVLFCSSESDINSEGVPNTKPPCNHQDRIELVRNLHYASWLTCDLDANYNEKGDIVRHNAFNSGNNGYFCISCESVMCHNCLYSSHEGSKVE